MAEDYLPTSRRLNPSVVRANQRLMDRMRGKSDPENAIPSNVLRERSEAASRDVNWNRYFKKPTQPAAMGPKTTGQVGGEEWSAQDAIASLKSSDPTLKAHQAASGSRSITGKYGTASIATPQQAVADRDAALKKQYPELWDAATPENKAFVAHAKQFGTDSALANLPSIISLARPIGYAAPKTPSQVGEGLVQKVEGQKRAHELAKAEAATLPRTSTVMSRKPTMQQIVGGLNVKTPSQYVGGLKQGVSNAWNTAKQMFAPRQETPQERIARGAPLPPPPAPVAPAPPPAPTVAAMPEIPPVKRKKAQVPLPI